MVIGDAEALAVALLQDDAPAQFGGNPLKMQRMDGETEFVRFPRGGQDAQAQLGLRLIHFFLAALLGVASTELAGEEAALLSARFSLMDLPDFADAA